MVSRRRPLKLPGPDEKGPAFEVGYVGRFVVIGSGFTKDFNTQRLEFVLERDRRKKRRVVYRDGEFAA